LDERGLFERNMLGNLHQPASYDPIHRPNVFRKAAAARLKSGCDADFLVHGTLGEDLVPAVIALPARDVMEDHDAVSDLKVPYASSCGHDLPCSFMTENSRRRMRTGSDLFEVRAADSAGVYTNQNLPVADLGDGDLFQADIVLAAVNGSAHRRRN